MPIFKRKFINNVKGTFNVMNLTYILAANSYHATLISDNHAISEVQSSTAVVGNSNFMCRFFKNHMVTIWVLHITQTIGNSELKYYSLIIMPGTVK